MTEQQRIDAIKELARPLSLEGRGRAAREVLGDPGFTFPFWFPTISAGPVSGNGRDAVAQIKNEL